MKQQCPLCCKKLQSFASLKFHLITDHNALLAARRGGRGQQCKLFQAVIKKCLTCGKMVTAPQAPAPEKGTKNKSLHVCVVVVEEVEVGGEQQQ